MSQSLGARCLILSPSSLRSYVPFSSFREGSQGDISPLGHSLSYLTPLLEGIFNETHCGFLFLLLPRPPPITSGSFPNILSQWRVPLSAQVLKPATWESQPPASVRPSLPLPTTHLSKSYHFYPQMLQESVHSCHSFCCQLVHHGIIPHLGHSNSLCMVFLFLRGLPPVHTLKSITQTTSHFHFVSLL